MSKPNRSQAEPVKFPNTPTSARGVTVTPRLPDFEFLDSTPRLWFGGEVGRTAFYNVFSLIATEVETFFIKDGRDLLKHVKNPTLRAEIQDFIKQEVNHSQIHARYNKLLEDRGYPVEETRKAVRSVLKYLDKTTNLQIRSAVVIAGEHVLAEFGNPIIEHPDMMADADPIVRHMWEWHLYEESEHKSIVMDAYREVFGDGLDAYIARLWALPVAVTFLSFLVVPAVHRFIQVDAERSKDAPKEWYKLLKWMLYKPGYFRTMGKRLAAFAKRDFHPWIYSDNSAGLSELRKRVVKESWELPSKSTALA